MKYVEGDISKAPEWVIIHGCNTQGKMNSGVAKALREKYPTIYDDYIKGLNEYHVQIGESIHSCAKTKIIGNLLTQNHYGYDGDVYASPFWIRKAINHFLFNITYRAPISLPGDYEYPLMSIASPKIGCGRGGLLWDDVKEIFESIEHQYTTETPYPIEFVIYDIVDQYSK